MSIPNESVTTAIELKSGILCNYKPPMKKKRNNVRVINFTVDTLKNSLKRNVEQTTLKDDPDGSDTVDQGCVNCVPGNSKENKEDVSLSMSSDDETEQAISLNMNKKSNNVAYKGEVILFIIERVIFHIFLFSNDKSGMMDIALLTANANQLRFLITYNSEEKTFIISATLIVLSLIIQVAVGIGMIYKVGV